MKRNKNITEKDIYYFYPYKKNPVMSGNTIPQPYVRKEDVSIHPYTLTYDIWLSIVKDYCLEVRDYILRGKLFKVPRMLGTWQLKKYKRSNRIDWGETQKRGEKTFFADEIGYGIIIKWHRTYKNSFFTFKNHWKIRMAKGFRIAFHDNMSTDSNFIYNIMDS